MGVLEAVGARIFARGPTVYVVTPTYRRANQAPVLVRLSQTLMLAKVRIFWVVVEEGERPSTLVRNILRRSGLAGVHLASRTPSKFRRITHGMFVARRMRAIEWLRDNAVLPSVLYFAKEDNSYDHRLFAQIAQVQRVGVFPVALTGAYNISSPLVSPDGRVVGFHEPSEPGRRFAMDLAGFAVNMRLVLSSASPNISFDLDQVATVFLESLGVTVDDLEPLARKCTEVLVWRTKMIQAKFPDTKLLRSHNITPPNNLPLLYKNIRAEETYNADK
ncbi:galactosylgalactosylxylosylprotein 3-beta-glucuronosyltransferase S-like [Dermacentor andersoni]|uniref:galactosylgalactosylxylosylprotein 3-beta-glucuronosyltransferase S-like n=1 Tax=Dermacentor andersoni TaxID=34620 RepID=UPI00215503D6|nr:galactosylgalactosylxylosylprotein 3-beta-glucuronosyltransferase S-like [Dermacentor andersoni]